MIPTGNAKMFERIRFVRCSWCVPAVYRPFNPQPSIKSCLTSTSSGLIVIGQSWTRVLVSQTSFLSSCLVTPNAHTWIQMMGLKSGNSKRCFATASKVCIRICVCSSRNRSNGIHNKNTGVISFTHTSLGFDATLSTVWHVEFSAHQTAKPIVSKLCVNSFV